MTLTSGPESTRRMAALVRVNERQSQPIGAHEESKGAGVPGVRSENGANESSETASEIRQARAVLGQLAERLTRMNSFRRPKEDQFRAESRLGKESLERLGTYDKTQAYIVTGRQKEDRSGSVSKVGEGPAATRRRPKVRSLAE